MPVWRGFNLPTVLPINASWGVSHTGQDRDLLDYDLSFGNGAASKPAFPYVKAKASLA
jgi:hypothetical protein